MRDEATGATELPPPDQPMTVAATLARWPTGAWKRELLYGVLYFYGEFDQRDIIYRRADLLWPARAHQPGG
ncbi:hypothetical protein [Streptomyces sp. NPDC006552]|uniref:hypothetical protein n=1 Tax=Streptomyces sp. NPDC006552 TaxID=3157179 RepID=UPI0033A62252